MEKADTFQKTDKLEKAYGKMVKEKNGQKIMNE